MMFKSNFNGELDTVNSTHYIEHEFELCKFEVVSYEMLVTSFLYVSFEVKGVLQIKK